MARKIISFLLFFLPFVSKAQLTFVSCADSLMINPYYSCFKDFQPVCGCDGVNYINDCAADYWGGLITSHNYKAGICDDLFIFFAPNPVSATSQPNYNNGSYLSMYLNDAILPTSVYVYLFDVFNRLQYQRAISVPSVGAPGNTVYDDQLTADFFDSLLEGVYLVVVNTTNAQQVKKIVKISND